MLTIAVIQLRKNLLIPSLIRWRQPLQRPKVMDNRKEFIHNYIESIKSNLASSELYQKSTLD